MQPEEEQEAAAVLQSSLEAAVQLDSFPKSVVNINCVIMESAGSELALLITAASLALADAAIPMFDLVAACQIVRNDLHLHSYRHKADPFCDLNQAWQAPSSVCLTIQ